jgi:hypothetical protein
LTVTCVQHSVISVCASHTQGKDCQNACMIKNEIFLYVK